jgi:hypothetical protein
MRISYRFTGRLMAVRFLTKTKKTKQYMRLILNHHPPVSLSIREDEKMAKKKFISNKLLPWIEARKKFHLSHAQTQMARELGLNPKKFGSLSNHKQGPWKLPIPQYIEALYEKQFGKLLPSDTASLEEKAAEKRKRKAANKAEKGNN